MVHLLAASTWAGSMIFFALVVIPAVRRSLSPDKRKEVVKAIGLRYRILGWVTVFILLMTGFLLAGTHGVDWHSTFGKILIFKLILIGIMLLLLFLHDFILAPRALKVPFPSQEGSKQAVALLARINLVVVVVIVLCGVWLTTAS